MTDRLAKLTVYHARALELKQQDVYDRVDTLEKTDVLSAEHLPDKLQKSILDFLRSVNDGKLSKVYLVHKQITPNYFTSMMVLSYKETVMSGDMNEIYHKIFRYPDTATDWQFSLFEYEDVKDVHVENIPRSCIYTGNSA